MNSEWKKLQNRMVEAWNMPIKPNFKRPKDNDTVDEQKSVRWNREEVKKQQEAWTSQHISLMDERTKKIAEVEKDIVNQIIADVKTTCDCKISNEAATMIWEKAYSRGHSFGFYDIYVAIEDYEEVVVTVLRKDK